MRGPSAAGIYSRLLRFYPRRFRDEYGIDMALLFAQQLRDESPSRVWARTAVDLAITVPARHLEDHMDRPPNPAVPLAFSVVSVSAFVLAALGGTALGPVALGLGVVVGVVAGALAITAWRRTRAIGAPRPAAERWWQILLVGATVMASTIVAVNVVGEVSEAWWLPMMLALLTGAVLTAIGLILGGVHVIENRPRRVPG